MDLHKLLQDNGYLFNSKYYDADGYNLLIQHLLDYSNAHSWFHYYGTIVPDSDETHYFHYVVLYWTEGQRPTVNTFNFIRIYQYKSPYDKPVIKMVENVPEEEEVIKLQTLLNANLTVADLQPLEIKYNAPQIEEDKTVISLNDV